VQRTGWCPVRELADRVGDTAPHRGAVVIVLRSGARGAFVEGLGDVPLEHQVCGAFAGALASIEIDIDGMLLIIRSLTGFARFVFGRRALALSRGGNWTFAISKRLTPKIALVSAIRVAEGRTITASKAAAERSTGWLPPALFGNQSY
jgi:hypothetical protein